jgi:transposase
VIGLPPGVRVLVATKPVDFRKGADTLAAVAKEALKQDPYAGTVLVFRAKRADRIKILIYDGTGLVLYWKALDQGAFKWPPISDGVMRLSPAQLSALVEGMDWTRVFAPRRRRPTAVR